MLLRHRKMWNDGPEDWSDSEQEDMLRGVCFGKGGSKNTAPTASTQTVSQTNLPEYAEPYVTGRDCKLRPLRSVWRSSTRPV